ncbi:Tetratricopeptide repeat-containing protein [Sphingobacterium nematocida]|uniref:Tetratricopeptide repeat-containing protein n=1 Tax=Sphingobacterium nematocida TaxID=1513896 RepID=A0A1T5B9W6_9SPHI|nr:tetratricopeptide repeat protein [Sphingobacterium nematocida]SKB44104.1 Tetratricopeptide repeat-containing protein [Sphingobacterium nematocida]
MLVLISRSALRCILPGFGLILFCSVLLFSCKSAKNKNRAFDKTNGIAEEKEYNFRQNFTTKYNILYNSNMMLDNERESIFHGAKKNYQVRQSVFDEPHGDGEPHKLMDSLIQKAYKIVNNKQESKYVNEAYLLIGKANYYKGAYHTSIEFFNQLLRTASEEQKQYLPLAYAWKSRALLQIGKQEAAKMALDSSFITLDEEKKSRTFVNAAAANYHVRVGAEQTAIPYLEYALESNSSTLDNRRWAFLLAQLYKDNGQKEKAFAYFDKIAKSNVPFDMAFEASLQAAFLEGDRGLTTVERVKPLKRMLKEGKNDGYQDQILYQIGDIYYGAGEDEEALTYFKKSLLQPKRNEYQSTETYLRLAEHYFDQQHYFDAQRYFDSVAMVLPADYTDVNKVRRKLGYMDEITTLYQEVAWQDTLLQLAALDDSDREATLDTYAQVQLSLKKREIERQKELAKKGKKRAKGESITNPAFAAYNQNQTLDVAQASDRTFYFSNPDELLVGQNAFKRRWGSRPLKDNWRYDADNAGELQNTTKIAAITTDSVGKEEQLDEVQFIATAKERYSKAIPKEKEAYEASHKIVHDKLIVIGNIYRDYTQDNRDAIKVYEEFLRRYPNTEAGAEIYYSLYRMYDGIDKAKSQDNFNKLVALFPNSLHAKVAQDPSYMDKIKRDKNILDRVFEKLFDLYAKGDHAAVIREADIDLKERFENTALVAQVEYLRALAIGRVGRIEDFTTTLTGIIERYPQDSLVVPLAKENLAFMAQNPQYFVHRVNALQDIDKSRIAFVDEPDMTAWPSLDIDGDYRSGTAIVKELPKPKEEPKKEVVVAKIKEAVKEEPKKEVIATKVEAKVKEEEPKKEVVVAKVEEKVKEEPKKEVVAAKVEEQVKEEELKRAALVDVKGTDKVGVNNKLNNDVSVGVADIKIANSKIDFGPNDYRDKKLFPDTAEYYFTVNVMDPKVNMAPSRYGIGQFNRTRYHNAPINHQLKVVNGENQLIFIGPFKSFEEVKLYESRLSPFMLEIMKVPAEIYNTFVITKQSIPSLTDGIEIKKYHQNYIEQ